MLKNIIFLTCSIIIVTNEFSTILYILKKKYSSIFIYTTIMKYIKKFESVSEIKVGEYVLIKMKDAAKYEFGGWGEIITNFINNTIGQIEGIQSDWVNPNDAIIKGNIIVKYTNIPKGTEDWFRKSIKMTNDGDKIYLRNFSPDQVVAFGETQEEVEMKVTANKYNV